jgi:hypothetical protein
VSFLTWTILVIVLPRQEGQALAMGVPTVMSNIVADDMGISSRDKIGCIGKDVASFKQCVLELHSNRKAWHLARMNGLDFVKQSPNRAALQSSWSTVIADAMTTRLSLKKCDPLHCLETNAAISCPHGESNYALQYPDVGRAIEIGDFATAWKHVDLFSDGQYYLSCCGAICKSGIGAAKVEAAYKAQYPDVAAAIDAGIFASAWDHFKRFGRVEGRNYSAEGGLPYVPKGGCAPKLTSILSPGADILPSVRQLMKLQSISCKGG